MECFVYILYSAKLDKFYRGQTNNITARIKRHNQQREQYTRDGVPWVILWSTEKPDRAEAIKLETKLKNLSRQRLINLMLKYEEDIWGPDELLLVKQLSGC